jgi:RHS repeat-associated protein
MLNRFDLNAKTKANGTAFSKFSQSLQISIQNTPQDLAGIDPASVRLYYQDDKTLQWIPITSSKLDPKTGILTATTDHFTNYGEQGNPNIVGPQRIMASQVDLQSGTGTFSYPLDLPVAPGGFQPKLSLSYNSGSADEMKSQMAVASWVGIGWSCSLGQISYDDSTSKYYLDLNGVSYQLISSDGTNYHTNPESYYKISRDTANNKWEMLDCDGYSYEFGGTTDSQQYIDNSGAKAYYQWSLNLMKDTNGNPAIIHYVQDIEGTSPNEWVRSAYPTYLRYGMTNVSDNNTYKFEVTFDTATETTYGTDGQLRPDDPISYTYSQPYDCSGCNGYQWIDTSYYTYTCIVDYNNDCFGGCEWPWCIQVNYIQQGYWQCNYVQQTCYNYYTNAAPKVMENRRLTDIQVKVGGSSGSLLRSYNFDYNFTNRVYSSDYGGVYYAGTMVLNSITEKGTDNATALPALSFSYSNLTTNYNNSPTFNWPHLTLVSNGFGGTIGFSYAQVPSSPTTMWSREVVTGKTIQSDSNNDQGISVAQTDSYAYLGSVSGNDLNPQYFGTGTSEQFRGFERVTDTDSANNYTQHYFFTTGTINGSDAEKLTGKEYKTDYYNSSSQLLREQVCSWSSPSVPTNNWFNELDQETTTNYQVGNPSVYRTSRTRYSYDSYGNVSTEFDDGDISINTDDSTIWTVFNPNTSANILDKPTRERTYNTNMTQDNGGANLIQETDYYYDGQTTYGTPPVKGNLTSKWQLIDVSHSITTGYTYDSYGNKLTETDPNNHPTTWTFDTTYHVYPATKTDAISTLTESYTYDPGTNNLLTDTGVNTQITSYYYDQLKRLISIVKPGDSQGSPSVSYQYNNWGNTISQNIRTSTKIDSTNGSIWSADYFDGLGRVIQTQAQSETTGHTLISSTTTYNSLGLTDKQYVSQDIGSGLSAYYSNGMSNWKNTSYVYDALGRVITQTNPDTTVVSNDYSTAWQTTTTDGNGFSNTYFYDAFARLAQVQNLPGTTVATSAASSIGDTTATLNGNLLVLANASSATVSFEYGTSTSYGTSVAGTPSSLTAAGTYTASLTGLTSATTYHFRAKATVGNTTVYGADQSFRTTGGSTPPTASTGAATNVSSTWATLNGSVSNLGSAASVTVSFDYGLTTSYGSTITATPSPMNATGSFTINLTGLTSGTLYHYRAKAVGNGTTNGSDQQFTTSSGGSPVVITKSVAASGDDGFTGSGTFDTSDAWYEIGHPNSSTTYNAWFRFTGITIPSGATIEEAHLIYVAGSFASGTHLKIFAEKAANPGAPSSQSNEAGRTRSTAYAAWDSGYSDYAWHNSPSFTTVIQELVNSYSYSNSAIQILVDNNGSSSGAETTGDTFESTGYAPQLYIRYHTSGGGTTPPAVSTSAASSVGTTTATLNGSLTGLGSASSVGVSFEYGTTTVYGSTATGSPASLTAAGTFTAGLTGLTSGTTYHYRTKAVGDATTWGNDQQFTTTSSGGGTPVEINAAVTAGGNDGFSGSGTFDNSDSWYEVGQPYNSWFRFTGITIPSGATIEAAYLTLVEGQWNTGTSLKISADDSQNPSAPTSAADHTSKTRTSAGVSWTSGSADYAWHNTPDLTSVVQELVNSYSYSSGAIQILVDNNGSSSGAEAAGSTYENTGYAPKLYIRYHTSSGSGGSSAPSVINTYYNYDALGNLTNVTNNNGKQTSMVYDGLSRKTSMSDPDMGNWSYTYDPDGNLVSQTDAKTQVISMVYDAMDRITNKNYPSGSGMTNIVYSYDGNTNGKGLRTGMTDASGSTTDSYDPRGRLVEETKTINSVPYTTDYTYDGLDRVVTITYPNPNGTPETVTNTYNGRGLPYSVSGSVAGNVVTGTTYNQLGDISEIDLGNTVITTYGYYGTGGSNDNSNGGYFGKLWEIKSTKTTTLQDLQYNWDANGNLIQRNVVSSQTENFSYDYLDRLTSVSGAYSNNYTYDICGNITSVTDSNGNTQNYSYGTQPDAVTAVGSTSYAYDSNGNMTTRGSQTITWDVENRPVSITGGTSFVYDGDGNRVEETAGSQTTLYINQYYEKNITTGVVTTYYYLGGQLVAQRTGSTMRFVSQDSLGSTTTMTLANGSLDSSIAYFPFGSARTGSVNSEKQFTGQMLDSTGLYYYNARYYDPTIGRFISADSIVQSISNPQTLNRYSYCANNPLNSTDPTGYFSLKSLVTKVVTAVKSVNWGAVKQTLSATAAVVIAAVTIVGGLEALAYGDPAPIEEGLTELPEDAQQVTEAASEILPSAMDSNITGFGLSVITEDAGADLPNGITSTFDGPISKVQLNTGYIMDRAYETGNTVAIGRFNMDETTASTITSTSSASKILAMEGASNAMPDRVATIQITRPITGYYGLINNGGPDAHQIFINYRDLDALKVISERTIK